MPSPADIPDMILPAARAAATGYLMGSLPLGYLVARSRGVDILEVGSRSPGATNVRRVLGRGPGNTVFFLDALKGALAAYLPLLSVDHFVTVLQGGGNPAGPDIAVILAAVRAAVKLGYVGLAFALVGHSFSCFTRFRGGKGVATAAGGLLILMPKVALLSALVWVVIFYSTRYVSLASIVGALSLPLLALVFYPDPIAIGAASIVAVFVVVRHRANVGRLLGGTEKKFERKKAPKDEVLGGAP
jgi:glycerol-3-phosphate acyltransferase PlsY